MPSSTFFPMDGESRITIDKVHHECHEGNLWTFHHENLAPASGLTTYIHLKTGAKENHIAFDWQAIGGNFTIKIYESPTLGTAGSAITANARNRVNVRNPATTLFLNPTVSTVGTSLIGTRTLLAVSTTQSKSNMVRQGTERILKPNTDYIVAATVLAASMAFTIDAAFYEEG